MARKSPTSPHVLSLMGSLGLPGLITLCYAYTMGLPPLAVWLVAVNLTLLAILGKDKFASAREWPRTPEFTLLLLTFLGGTPAILVGRPLFKHKTKKETFVAAMWGAICAQAICIYLFYPTLLHWLKSPLSV